MAVDLAHKCKQCIATDWKFLFQSFGQPGRKSLPSLVALISEAFSCSLREIISSLRMVRSRRNGLATSGNKATRHEISQNRYQTSLATFGTHHFELQKICHTETMSLQTVHCSYLQCNSNSSTCCADANMVLHPEPKFAPWSNAGS